MTDTACDHCAAQTESHGIQYWVELLGMLALILIVGHLLGGLPFASSLAPKGQNILGFGAIFVVGLVSAISSCLALVGGLLLSVAAAWRETHGSSTVWQRFKPLALFNIGRLVGYFVLGGIVGAVGGALSLATQWTGLLTTIIAIVMVLLGLSLIHVVPKGFCRIPLPKAILERIRSLSQSGNPLLALLLGALTFFVPCGFTQSMQLLALGSGSFLRGGTIMLVFALGTLPSLVGISLLSSAVEGKLAQWFLRFSGVLVIVLGVLGMRSGLLLMGYDIDSYLPTALFAEPNEVSDDPSVTIDNQGRQIISLTVTDQGYAPNSFTIAPGRETWVYAVAPQGVSGCATFLQAPTFNIRTPIQQGANWLGPIQDPEHDFVLTCSMGTLRANVHVKNS